MNNDNNEKVGIRVLKGLLSALLAAALAVFVYVVMNY